MIGGWNTSWATGEVDVFDPRAKTWYPLNGTSIVGKEFLDTMPKRDSRKPFIRGKYKFPIRSYHGQTVHKGLIYILGGMDENEVPLTSVVTLNAMTGALRKIESMHQKRTFLVATSCKGVLYALGGHNGSRRLATVEKFNEDINDWVTSLPMLLPRSDSSCATVNGLVLNQLFTHTHTHTHAPSDTHMDTPTHVLTHTPHTK